MEADPLSQVTVTIAGKTYRMACDDGQEAHLSSLGDQLSETIELLRHQFGEIGDQRLTVMSAITVLDQLSETERRLKGLEAEVRSLRESRDALLERQGEVERRLAEKVADAAARIDAAAEKMV